MSRGIGVREIARLKRLLKRGPRLSKVQRGELLRRLIANLEMRRCLTTKA